MTAPPPSIVQMLFVCLYAGLWFVGWVVLPAIGRPEKLIVAIGLLALPAAAGSRRLPSATVTVGLLGLLGTYVFSYFLNGPTAEGGDFIFSLAARLLFLWLCFVLLQDTVALKWAMWLLILSSLFAAAVAFLVMARYGIGIGRLDPKGLEFAYLGPVAFSTFASAQLAVAGAILLLGAQALFTWRTIRFAAVVAAFGICAAAYLSYFRREHLISIPLVLLMLVLSGDRARKALRGAAIVAIAGFIAVVGWDYFRTDSVLALRMESEFRGSFVHPQDTRLTNFQAQLSAIAASPILGYGAGSHTAAIGQYVPTDERFLSGFNILGWLAVEGGLPCAFFYLIMLIGVWRVAWRWRHQPGSDVSSVVLRCAPALTLQIVLWGVFGNAWDLPLGWFVLGMILAAAQLAEQADRGPREAGGWRTIPYRSRGPVREPALEPAQTIQWDLP